MVAAAAGIPSALRPANPRFSPRLPIRAPELHERRPPVRHGPGMPAHQRGRAAKRRRRQDVGVSDCGDAERGSDRPPTTSETRHSLRTQYSRPQPSPAVPNRRNQRSIPGLTSLFSVSQREPTAQDQIAGLACLPRRCLAPVRPPRADRDRGSPPPPHGKCAGSKAVVVRQRPWHRRSTVSRAWPSERGATGAADSFSALLLLSPLSDFWTVGRFAG
jgi:hypothetical protein